jgi:hypothetical protein
MQQAIAGVSPSELGEVTIMTIWPSMAGTPLGRLLGQLYSIRFGFGPVMNVGNLLALLSIPVALHYWLFRILPFVCRDYRLTNRRVLVERTLPQRAERWVTLDDFDAIDIVVRPGQEWFRAGDLIFRQGQFEKLRLEGVLNPETFRHTCLKAQKSHIYVLRDMARQSV